MDPSFDRILDSLPKKRSRSRLEPYAALIKELLRRRRTYREIALVLLDTFQIHTSISTIHEFVQRWMVSAGKGGLRRIAGAQQKARKNPNNGSAKIQMPNIEVPITSDEVQKRITALKSRPVPAAKTKIFHYDPDQPLHISSPPLEADK